MSTVIKSYSVRKSKWIKIQNIDRWTSEHGNGVSPSLIDGISLEQCFMPYCVVCFTKLSLKAMYFLKCFQSSFSDKFLNYGRKGKDIVFTAHCMIRKGKDMMTTLDYTMGNE